LRKECPRCGCQIQMPLSGHVRKLVAEIAPP
jgi:hypothetical protein